MKLKIKILKKIDHWRRRKIDLYGKAFEEGRKFGRHEYEHQLLVDRINRP